MRIAVLGAGAMGRVVALLLSERRGADVVVLDVDAERAKAAADRAGGRAVLFDASRQDDLVEALREVEAVATCLPYRMNLHVMEASLAAGCHYADLGGLYHTTLRQLELDGRFREAGLAAIVGVGCCPGTSNLLARMGADRLDAVDAIDLLNGSVEEGDAGFGVPYSAETILDEFTMPAMVFEDGRLREVPPGSGQIRHTFREPIGTLECVYTLHSELATLPSTIEGVRDVRWRLGLPPAIATGFRTLADLGLGGTEPVDAPGGRVVPRDVLLALLAGIPPPTGPPRDVEMMVVLVTGTLRGRPARFTAEAMFRPPADDVTAGAFGTALPIALAAPWLASGRVAPGVHPPETALPADEFVDELAAEGVELTLRLEEDRSPSGASWWPRMDPR